MRKLRKFLRLLLILLPFSLFGFAFANEVEGTTDNNLPPYPLDGFIDGIEGTDPISIGIRALFEEQKERWEKNNAWYNSAVEDYNSGRMSTVGRDNFEKFEGYLNHYLTYGTTEEIEGEEITSENWANPSYLNMRIYSQAFALFDGSSEAWIALNNMNGLYYTDDTSQNILQTSGGIAHGTSTYNNGAYTISAEEEAGSDFNLDPTIGRAYVKIDGAYDEGEVAFYSSDPDFYVTIVQGESVGDSENKVKAVENDSTIIVWLHFSSLNYSFTIYTDDFVFGGVPAVEIPDFEFPSKTNSDGTVNNYYDKEVNDYYYYMNTANNIQNAGRTQDFTFDIEWGLLNLPAGIMLGLVSALGDYSSHCVFQVSSMSFDIFGNDLTIPAMSFNFNADDYAWLLPFRYIIALMILYALAKGYWGLISNLINGGDDNAI